MPLRFSTLYRKTKYPSRDFSHTGVWGEFRRALALFDYAKSILNFFLLGWNAVRSYLDITTLVFFTPRFAFFRPRLFLVAKTAFFALVERFIILINNFHHIFLFIPQFDFIAVFHNVVLKLGIFLVVHRHFNSRAKLHKILAPHFKKATELQIVFANNALKFQMNDTA